MENEEKIEEQSSVVEQNYIDTIKNLKETTVSKKDYEELAQQNKQLLDVYLNGSQPEGQREEVVDTEAIINELRSNNHLSNLEFIKNVVTLRKARLEEGKGDIFVPQGSQYTPDSNDFATAEKVASVFEECIEIADGDPAKFTFELQQRMADTPILRR